MRKNLIGRLYFLGRGWNRMTKKIMVDKEGHKYLVYIDDVMDHQVYIYSDDRYVDLVAAHSEYLDSLSYEKFLEEFSGLMCSRRHFNYLSLKGVSEP